jgi:SAM-dependent methyltransferase
VSVPFEKIQLQCPVTHRPLKWNGAAFIEEESGREYRESNGIFHLVKKDKSYEVARDLDHYDRHPFEYFEWEPDELRLSVIEEDFQRFSSSIPRDSVICDIGCGAGRISAYLQHEGFTNTLAVDFSYHSLVIARRNLQRPVIRANNLSLPFRTESIDVLVSSGVIHHTVDPLKALSENCRVLRNGGWMYLKVYRHHSCYHFIHSFIGAPMRLLVKQGSFGKLIVEKWLFGVYKLASKILKRGRTEKDMHLRALFHDYFMNPQTNFLRPDAVAAALHNQDMKFTLKQSSRPTNLYLVQKQRPN